MTKKRAKSSKNYSAQALSIENEIKKVDNKLKSLKGFPHFQSEEGAKPKGIKIKQQKSETLKIKSKKDILRKRRSC